MRRSLCRHASRKLGTEFPTQLYKRKKSRWFSLEEVHMKIKVALSRIPVGRPRTIVEPITRRILDEIAWNFTPSEMMDMTEDREVWLLNLELLPPQPSRKRGQ